MSASVTLFDPATGVRRTFIEAVGPTADDIRGFEYIWTDGNYSCDCNRRLFLASNGAPGYDEERSDCGNTIVLEALTLDDGTNLLDVRAFLARIDGAGK